jgi:phytoene dehydrogenase-like protein
MSEYKNYDAIVIGAGISGLVCGCYLAKAGMKVLVIEQHDKPGGYCTSFKRKGFSFDAAAHSFGSYREGGNFRQILTELGISSMINITRCNPSDVVVTPDFRITFWNDPHETINELSQTFPNEKENIQRFFSYFDSLASTDQFENIKLKDKTFGSILDSFFTDNSLKNALSFPVLGNGGLPPSLMHAFTGTKIFREFLIDGGYYPEGGMQGLPNAMGQVISQHEGNIIYRKLVKRILVNGNAVSGVELDDSETITAKYIVSACDITQTMKTLITQHVSPNSIVGKLETMIPSISTFTLYLGIGKPFPDLPKPGTNIWHLPDYDLDRIFKSMTNETSENFSDSGFMFRVSPDRKTMLAFCGAPFKTPLFWKENKKRIAGDFLSRIEHVVPNLKEHISYFDAATPSTQHRYTLNHQGANYGWAPLHSQLFDPDFRQKTFIKGLYLTGHWTCQTHGIPGVAYLGHNTAKLIIKNEKNHVCN